MEEETEPTEETEETEPEKPKQFDAEYISGLRHEAAKYRMQGKEARLQLEELEIERKRLETEHADNLEKGRAEIVELQQKLLEADRDLEIQEAMLAVTEAAAEMGFNDPAKVFDLLGDFDIDKIPQALKKLAKENPELVTPEPPPPTPGAGGPPIASTKLSAAQMWLQMLRGGRR